MSEAAAAFRGTIVLPDTPKVAPSDAGAFWIPPGDGGTYAVAVTFPTQGLFISYEWPPVPDPRAYIEQSVKDDASSKLVWLGSTPAWVIPEPSDGSHPGIIQFVAGRATVQVDGHTDEASLEAIAQSIVDRAAKSG